MPLKRLFKTLVDRSRAEPAVPEGKRVYAIGDIHGRLDLLDSLIARIDDDDARRGEADTRLIFLGDLVDRGPQSRQVIERLLELKESGRAVTFLLGNHDEVFLKASGGDLKALRFLIKIGGKETVLSYGIGAAEYSQMDFAELSEVFADLVPQSHRDFLASFEDYVDIGDYVFVHAGIRPGLPVQEQKASDLRWIRREFLDYRNAHEKIVVHGHSISSDVDVQKNRIGIDTGAFASGRLTAIGLEGRETWFLTAVGPTDPRWEPLSD